MPKARPPVALMNEKQRVAYAKAKQKSNAAYVPVGDRSLEEQQAARDYDKQSREDRRERQRQNDDVESLVKYKHNGHTGGCAKKGWQALTLDKYKDVVMDVPGKAPKKCRLCGQPRRKGEVLGIDRIDSTLQYIPGNMEPAHGRCNKAKFNFSDDQLRETLQLLASNQADNSRLTPGG